MSRHSFQHIETALSFADEAVSSNPWNPFRPLTDGFNERRSKVVSPGEILCVDACMSSWQERESKYTHDGLPYKTKIARKPKGKGTELKSIAGGDTGILLELDLVEGAQRQQRKACRYQLGERTAVVLRLSEPFRGSGRTAVADSTFSGEDAGATRITSWSDFMGMIKAATKGYPKAALSNWFTTAPSRGSFNLFTSTTSSGGLMYAMCWANRKPKTIISNRGTALPENVSVRARHPDVLFAAAVSFACEESINEETGIPSPTSHLAKQHFPPQPRERGLS